MENDDKSILLQFAKFSKGFQISDFDEFVQESVGVENLDFFGRLAYPNQWQMGLSNSDIREDLIRMGRTRIKNRSCWMYPLNQLEIRGFVHWLPNSVTNDELKEQLELYGKVLFIENHERTIMGRKVKSDARYYGLMLSHENGKESIPYFFKLNGFLCHLAVRGREPACFHCKEVGHRRTECTIYKEKLISYCNRDPNSAPPRLKPRGRRYLKVETEVKDKTGGDKVSSSADIVPFEKEVSVDEETTEDQLLPVLEDREYVTEVQEEVTSSTEKKLEQAGILTERTAKSCIGTSAASFSQTEIQGIFETLQQIQRKTAEDLRQRFQSFGKDIVETLARGKLSTYAKDQIQSTVLEAINISANLQQEIGKEELEKQTKKIRAPKETFIPVERSVEDSSVTTNIQESRGDEISPLLPTIHQENVDSTEIHEQIPKKAEEAAKVDKSPELTVSGTTSSVLLNLEKAKQTTIETFQSTFQKLEEFTKSTDVEPKLTKGEMQTELVLLKQTKKTASDYLGSTFKKLEEEIASLLLQMSNEQSDADTTLTKDDIQFAHKVLIQTKEAVEETLQNTFRKLAENLEKETKPAEITTKSSGESKSSPKIAEISTKSTETLKQQKKESFDIVKHFVKEGTKVVVDTEDSEKQSTAEKKQKGTFQTESKPEAISQSIFKAAKISEYSEKSEKELASEKAFIASQGMESHVSKSTQENNDELQLNIRKVFTSVLAKDELLPETRAILKQVQSKVNEVVEDIKRRQ